MTIGERVKARLFKAKAIGFGFWLLFAAGLLLPSSGTDKAWWFLPFIGCAGSVLYIVFSVKCPKCGIRIGQALSGISKAKFCPGCGVGFDRQA